MSHFSARTAFARDPSPLSAWLAERRPAIDLTESNPTRCGFLQPEAVARLGDPSGVRYAPDPRGEAAAREAVARYYGRRGVAIDPDRVVLATSSSEAYGWLFKLLCDPGDAVLAPVPSYPLFPFLARLEGARLAPYRLAAEEGFRIDRGDLARALSDRARGVLAVSPANPTGHYLHDEDADHLEEIAAARGLALVVDEVFHDFHLGPHPRASFVRRARADSFVLSGLSKVALLPQLKLGWIVVSGPRAAEAMARLEVIADTYLSVSTAVQRAAPSILDAVDELQIEVRGRLRENLAALDAAIAAMGPSCPVRRLPVAGGWYALVEVPRTRSDEAWVRRLVDLDDILVQPGYFYDLEADGVMVVSLLLAPATFAEAIGRAVARWSEG